MPPDDAYAYAVMEDAVPVYEEFLLVYPNDPRAEWVRTTLALRVDAMAWRYASVVNTPEAYAAYAARYPGGVYVDEAVRLRLRPRLRPIDVVFAPRFIAPPPAPRVALPLIQMRRTASAPIVLPVVYSRPGQLNPSVRFAPGQRLPAFNPATGARFNAATATPGPHGYPRERLVNPNLAPAGPLRSSTVNAVNGPTGPNAAPLYRPPAARVTPQLQTTTQPTLRGQSATASGAAERAGRTAAEGAGRRTNAPATAADAEGADHAAALERNRVACVSASEDDPALGGLERADRVAGMADVGEHGRLGPWSPGTPMRGRPG